MFMPVRGSSPIIVPKRVFADETAFSRFIETVKAYHQVAETGINPA
jgi:hypothetical protein